MTKASTTTPVPETNTPASSAPSPAPKPPEVQIEVSSIHVDSGIQMREAMDERAVVEYSESLLAGVQFPPVVLVKDPEGRLLLADGFHRVAAHRRAGVLMITARVYSGDRLTAIRWALRANTTHGLRRTNADKRKAVRVALREFPGLSTHEIARMTRVSQAFVSIMKREPVAKPTAPESNKAHVPHELVPEPEVVKASDPNQAEAHPPGEQSRERTGKRRRREAVDQGNQVGSKLALAHLTTLVTAMFRTAGLANSQAGSEWDEACDKLHALAKPELDELLGSDQGSARSHIRRVLQSVRLLAERMPDGGSAMKAIDALLRELKSAGNPA